MRTLNKTNKKTRDNCMKIPHIADSQYSNINKIKNELEMRSKA